MLRKALSAFCIAALLTGCDQNLSTSVYLRDVQELLAAAAPRDTPMDIEIEILEAGLDKYCSLPDGQKFVDAVASVFGKASVVKCENIAASMNDRMVIKATILTGALALLAGEKAERRRRGGSISAIGGA